MLTVSCAFRRREPSFHQVMVGAGRDPALWHVNSYLRRNGFEQSKLWSHFQTYIVLWGWVQLFQAGLGYFRLGSVILSWVGFSYFRLGSVILRLGSVILGWVQLFQVGFSYFNVAKNNQVRLHQVILVQSAEFKQNRGYFS